ncbi:hypothetical protein C0195_03000 [Candidatus Bathyarchaeota archaeon]|nr:MAG: hypothetical protein C0195_03000 [Candidatus Bathyarchaeota archaeon]
MEKFPERIYTHEEVKKAKELIDKGYKHRLRIKGNTVFKEKARQALKLVKTAGYYDFLKTYIRCIVEIDGLTQLRESEASIWANRYAVENPVDAASLFVQKAHHMREYLEGKLYYGGEAEKRSVGKRIEFLKVLKEKTREDKIKVECERLLKLWYESSIVY